jgi:hypothetical protein
MFVGCAKGGGFRREPRELGGRLMSTEPAESDKSIPVSGDARSDERRCGCGKLAARLTTEGVEIKCSRCKRVMVVSWSEMPEDGAFSGEADD